MTATTARERLVALLGKSDGRRPWASLALGAVVVALLWYVLPAKPRNPLWETTAWSLLVVVSFVGHGSLLAFFVAKDERVDAGLRAVWGASVIALVGGVLMVPALMKRDVAMIIVEVGIGLALVALARERASVGRSARFVGRVIRREPRLAVVAGIVLFMLAIQYLSGVADWHTNPYDDDIAYLAFLKKLNDTGTVIEPFSFRRLSALGGQTLFLQLVSIRAEPTQAHTFDRSICVLMVAMLVAGHRARGRRMSLVFALLAITFFVTLPLGAINTASYYSGVVFFLGLFRTLSWLDDRRRAPWAAALPVALVSAAACTLRQNYLPVPVFALAASYGLRVFASRETRAERWSRRLAEPLLAAGFTLAALVPWLASSWQSSHTFLFPLMLGTFNRALELKAAGMNWVRELWYQVWTAVEGIGIKTFPLFLLGAAILRERGSRRPMWSLAIGAAAGFVLLVHGFTQSDAGNIGRYAFASLMAFALAVALGVGTSRLDARPGRTHTAAAIALFAVMAQIVLSREDMLKAYTTTFHNIEELHYSAPHSRATLPFEFELHERLQQSVPRGERMAVLLDEPHYLDFQRNPIWNLDMPGYASLPPGMPFFKGSAELAKYLTSIGVRYLVFVRPEYSRYHYRREYWIEMLANEQEIWRAFSPYLLDFLDMLTDLATKHKKLFEEKGLVVLDLAEAP